MILMVSRLGNILSQLFALFGILLILRKPEFFSSMTKNNLDYISELLQDMRDIVSVVSLSACQS